MKLAPLLLVGLATLVTPVGSARAQSGGACEGLGLRAFTIGKPPGAFFASPVSGLDISGPDWTVDSLDLCAGETTGDGVYPLSLTRDVVLGVPTIVPGLVACLRIEASGSSGALDCDGGTPMDVRITQDSNGPAPEDPPVVESGLGPAGRPGEAVLFADMSLELVEGAASSADCLTVVFDPGVPVALTTAKGEQVIDDPVDFLAGLPQLRIEATGEPFDCAEWATAEGPGLFVTPVAALDMPIVGDAAAILQLGDQVAPTGPLCEPVPIDAAILSAGNEPDEKERYRLLDELAAGLPVGDPLRTDLELVLPVIDQWANGREKFWVPGDQTLNASGYLANFFDLNATPGSSYPPKPDATSPVCPIWAMYRGRMMIHQAIQTAFILNDPTTRQSYMDGGREAIGIAATAFPGNPVLPMWLDQPIPWPAVGADPGAPEWANLQREALGKLADIIDFWIDERQAPDGQFGGGWSDDVEMWRLWTPILVGFQNDELEASQRLLSEGIFDLPRLAGGYTDILTDVEHSSEDTGDSITSMLHIDPHDGVWAGRADRLAELLSDVWGGRNNRGAFQFESVYFTSSANSADPAYACDTPYNTRAVQPALLLWQRTRAPALTALFTDWLDTWVDATASGERGKPAGVVPAAVHWPSGEPAGPEPDWWDPGCAATTDRGLYIWPSQLSPKLRSFVLANWITGDDDYLDPLRSMADLRRAYLADPAAPAPTGSAVWAGRRMGGVLTESLAKHRMLSGDTSFDDLLATDASPYMRLRLTGDNTSLLQSLRKLVDAFRINRESYTSEVRWTDRIFRFAGNYANYYANPTLPQPSIGVLYSMLTGDPGDPLYLPLNAVRWQTGPRDFAALVEASGPGNFTARIHHFGATERAMGAELLLLDPGRYAYHLACGEPVVQRGDFVVDADAPVIDFTIPAGGACVLEVKPGIVIDIRPQSPLNIVRPTAPGLIPVALFGSEEFDVGAIDLTTLTFGPAGALSAGSETMPSDLDLDGHADRVVRFQTTEAGIAMGDDAACIQGELMDGTAFEGCDQISTLPGCGSGYQLALLAPVVSWSLGRRRRRSKLAANIRG